MILIYHGVNMYYKKEKKQKTKIRNENYTENDLNRLIEMAWQDRTTFDTIYELYGLTENQVKKKMRSLISPKGFKRWRKRVQGRKTKHKSKVTHKVIKFQGPW